MSCKVYLDHYTGCYNAGDTITGRFIVYLNKRKNVRGVKIRLKCNEHTEWTERESHYNNHTKRHESRYVTYTGNNDIIFKEIKLHGEGDIGPGSLTFPFSFSLDSNGPSTFNGSYGSIQYYIKGLVDRPYKFDYEDKHFFTVFSPINFNHMSANLQDPRYTEDEKTVCCWCCANGHMSCSMTIDKNAFVVGEIMRINVKVTNLSNVSIEDIEFKLTQKLESKVTSPGHREKTDTEYVSAVKHSGVGANGEHDFVVDMEIPAHTVAPNFNRSKLFEINYKLKATFTVDGCHTDLDLTLYPVLGHIAHDRQRVRGSEWVDVEETTTIGGDAPGANPPPYVPGNIGFTNGQNFPNLPPGGFVPMPMPGGSTPYPPAPPAFEKGMYAGDGRPTAPSDPNTATAPELPPPTYNEATTFEQHRN